MEAPLQCLSRRPRARRYCFYADFGEELEKNHFCEVRVENDYHGIRTVKLRLQGLLKLKLVSQPLPISPPI